MWIIRWTSSFCIKFLEKIFYRWGYFATENPLLIILSSLILTAISCIGFIRLRQESHAEKLWIPSDSSFLQHKAWLEANFPRHIRIQTVLFAAQNSQEGILNPQALLQMLEVHKSVNSFKVQNSTWNELCYRIPIANILLNRRRKRRRKRDQGDAEDTDLVNRTVILDVETTTESLVYYDEYDESNDDPWDTYNDYQGVDVSVGVGNETQNPSGASDDQDFMADLPPEIYCDLVETLNDKCWQQSILEIWKFDEDLIKRLSSQDIIDAINNVKTSPVYGYNFNYDTLLGEVKKNSSGHVIGAASSLAVWQISVQLDNLVKDTTGTGTDFDSADEASLLWEKQMLNIVLDSEGKILRNSTVLVYPIAARSYNDVSSEAIMFDGVKMVLGYFLMFVYTTFMLGPIDKLEFRLFLTIAGISSIGMGLLVGIGISSAFSIPFTQMHAILPFICLGIGIDDMFVILQCWYNHQFSTEESLPHRVGLTMKHAGVAITITSLTDVCAFGIGAVTILPGLQSFCLTAAFSIAAIFFLQSSWFVAWLSIDQRRIERNFSGLLPCIELKVQSTKSNVNKLSKVVFHKYATLLINSNLVKIVVIVLCVILVSFGIWGSLLMRQEFNTVLLLPVESYVRQSIEIQDRHFPQNGWVTDYYTGKLKNFEDLKKYVLLMKEFQKLVQNKQELRGMDSWWFSFESYLKAYNNSDHSDVWMKTVLNNSSRSEDWKKFQLLLSDFLFSSIGSKYTNNFKFNGSLRCGYPAPPIKASQTSLTFFRFTTASQHIQGRNVLDELIEKYPISSASFTFSKIYAAWESDKVIGFELWRNLSLAVAFVFFITLLLLVNIKLCLFVLICVILTLVDIVGFLHFWGLTIDTLSCINIILSVGLCVDYSAHIAHSFHIQTGSNSVRAVRAIELIGPAVFNGGVTTFSALILLAFSKSHVFITFFRVFFLTVIIGLFHGLVFLPVILSVIGPSVMETTDDDEQCNVESSKKKSVGPEVEKIGNKNQGFQGDDDVKLSKLHAPRKREIEIGGRNSRKDLPLNNSIKIKVRICVRDSIASSNYHEEVIDLSMSDSQSDTIKEHHQLDSNWILLPGKLCVKLTNRFNSKFGVKTIKFIIVYKLKSYPWNVNTLDIRVFIFFH